LILKKNIEKAIPGKGWLFLLLGFCLYQLSDWWKLEGNLWQKLYYKFPLAHWSKKIVDLFI
jgi:hypothetical protein